MVFISGHGFITLILVLLATKKIRESRVSQMHKGEEDESQGHGTNKRIPIRMFPRVTWSLLKNGPFICTILAGASEGILTSGFATFVPKYIQNRFGVSSGLAALYTGGSWCEITVVSNALLDVQNVLNVMYD